MENVLTSRFSHYHNQTESFMYNLLSLMFSIAACGEECPEPATQDYSDVEDIPIPSQDRGEDEDAHAS